MKSISVCLLFLCLGSRLFGAEEFGTIRQVFTARGYDDNDVIQMAAIVEPPPKDGRALKFERMQSEVDFAGRSIRLRPIYGPAETLGEATKTVVFPLGCLPAGKYEILADQLAPSELRVSVASTQRLGKNLHPKLQNLGLTQYNDGRLVLSLWYERRPIERLSEIQTSFYSDSILVVPILKIVDEESPTTFSGWYPERLEIRLPEALPSRTFALLIKGRTSGTGTRLTTSDILKIVDMDATQAALPKGIRYLSGVGSRFEDFFHLRYAPFKDFMTRTF